MLGGQCPAGKVRSEETELCVTLPWSDFAGCAEEARDGACEEPDEWIQKHCCASCGSCKQTTSPPPVFSWMPVDGGMDRACRGSSANDNSKDYYSLYTQLFSLAACKTKCEETADCKGIEYNPSGRCEVWSRAGGIQASAAVRGFTCLRLGEWPSTTTRQPIAEGFEAVDGGEGRVCRGADSTDNSASYYTLHAVAAVETCKALCVSSAGCRGIEFSQRLRRCEVWTRPNGIQASRAGNGFQCYSYAGSTLTQLQEIQSTSLQSDVVASSPGKHEQSRRSRRHAFLGTALVQKATEFKCH